MSDRIDISIRSQYDASGAKAALRDAEALSRAQPRGGGGGGGSRGGADPAAQAAKAERAILAQASAQARLQTVTGDLAGAQTTLGGAIGKLTPNSIAAIRAQTQLAQVQNKVAAEAARAAGGVSSFAQQVGSELTNSLIGIAGPAAVAGTAIAAIGKGVELAQLGAQADLVAQRFDSLAVAAGSSGDAILGALQKASGGEISDLNLQLAANRAMMLGVADSTEEFNVLMAIARDRAQALGTDSTTAFNDLVTGLGRGSAEILDNLGIMINAQEVQNAYAASLGKTADALTAAEKKQAIINAVIAQGNASLAETGGAVDSNAAAFARLGAAAENAKNQIGSFLAEGLAPVANSSADVLGALEGTREGFANASVGLQELLIQLGGYPPAIATAAEGNAQFADATERTADVLFRLLGIGSEAEAQIASTAVASESAATSFSYQSEAMIGAAQAQQEAANAAAMHTAAILDDRQANILAAEASGMLSQATLDAALQHQIAAQQAEQQAAKTELLNAQAQAAVQEFLRLHPTLSATGVAAAGAAAGLSPLQIELAQTAIQAAEAQSALSAFQRQAALGAGIGSLAPKRGLVERGPVGGALGQGANSSAAGQAFRTRAAINAAFPTAQAAPRARGGGGGGGGGAAARVNEAERAGEQLAQIEERVQEQLAAIDERGAERRAAAFRKLNSDIATSSADLVASQEANDLDLVGASEEQMGRLRAREEAEGKARIRNAEAVAEAQATAQAGNAELAQEQLDIRQDAIAKQQDLDEKYAAKQAELAGNDEATAALKREYDEATAAAAEAENVRIMLAQAAAQQRAAEADQEKARVIAAAQEQAAAVKGATDSQRSAVVSSLDAQGAAFSQWARAMDQAADTVVAAAGRSAKAIQGISSPATGAGSTVANGGDSGAAAAPAGGGAMLGRATLGGGRAAAGGGAVDVIAEASAIVALILSQASITKQAFSSLDLYRVILERAVGVLKMAADLRLTAQQASSPLSAEVIGQLVSEARLVLDLTRHALVPTNERQVEIFERYAATVQSSIGVLSDMAGLRQTLSDAMRNSSPFDMVAVTWLARRAAEFTALVLSQLLPTTGQQVTAMEQYATAVGASVDIIGGLAGLRETVTEAMKNSAPFDSQQIAFLVGRAKEFVGLVQRQLVPTTEATAAGFDAYATSVGASVEIIGGVATLRQTVTEAMANSQPFDSKQIAFLVARAREFTALVRDQLVPVSEAQSEEIARYAEAVTASAAALKAPLELSGNLFADYVSPSDAQLDRVVDDGRRFVERLTAAAKVYGADGVAAAEAYGKSVGAAFGAAKEQLLFFDALGSGDYRPQPQALAEFEAGTMDMLDVMERLGGRAAAIPAGNIAALQSAAGALSATADSLINLAAVPTGNLSGIASGLGGGSSTTTSTTMNTFNNTFVLPAGSTQQQANEIMGIVRRQMENRR